MLCPCSRGPPCPALARPGAASRRGRDRHVLNRAGSLHPENSTQVEWWSVVSRHWRVPPRRFAPGRKMLSLWQGLGSAERSTVALCGVSIAVGFLCILLGRIRARGGPLTTTIVTFDSFQTGYPSLLPSARPASANIANKCSAAFKMTLRLLSGFGCRRASRRPRRRGGGGAGRESAGMLRGTVLADRDHQLAVPRPQRLGGLRHPAAAAAACPGN